MSKTREEYEQEIADLKAANRKLLENYESISMAYMATRISRLEEDLIATRRNFDDRMSKAAGLYNQALQGIETLSTELRGDVSRLAQKIEGQQ
ncbi:MAG: hypothetical protein KDB22_26110 [Planctomycetales bacterium]|nr:hypothetical protein [Planctomycetales bacterium]